MFATIYLPNFYLQAALRHQTLLPITPVALIDENEKKPVIIQLNPAAEALGVRKGMTPSQGLARCLTLLIKTRSSLQEKTIQEIAFHHGRMRNYRPSGSLADTGHQFFGSTSRPTSFGNQRSERISRILINRYAGDFIRVIKRSAIVIPSTGIAPAGHVQGSPRQKHADATEPLTANVIRIFFPQLPGSAISLVGFAGALVSLGRLFQRPWSNSWIVVK